MKRPLCVCVCPPLAALRHYFLVNRHLPTLHTNVGQWLNAARERGGGGGGGEVWMTSAVFRARGQ